jgi:CheY-like chemotaxis protein
MAAKILVVEDNPLNLELVRDILVGAGYVVVEAEDGETGLELARREKPDLILMDIQLPGLDGLEATRRMRADPELAAVPILALTAHAMRGEEERALAAGCDGFITKPIRLKEFSALVAAHLRQER